MRSLTNDEYHILKVIPDDDHIYESDDEFEIIDRLIKRGLCKWESHPGDDYEYLRYTDLGHLAMRVSRLFI